MEMDDFQTLFFDQEEGGAGQKLFKVLSIIQPCGKLDARGYWLAKKTFFFFFQKEKKERNPTFNGFI
jgi:hypothetical protein